MVELTPLMQRYLAAQLAGDRQEALRVVLEEGVERGVDVSRLELEVIQPAQYEIGRLWQENLISVVQEHVATGISQLALAQLYPHLRRAPRTGSLALVACVEGEQHDMGARVAADHLEMRGYDVRYLGASVPTYSLVDEIRKQRPQLVAISATMPQHLVAVRDAVSAVCEAAPNVPIAVGGRAFADVPGFEAPGARLVWCATLADLFARLSEAA